ncbi:hypothetical protein BGZ72_004557 [Mortierella alpina]|nr:hypothetical protein BGZ72_004557 [Mortierella alpina]
MDSHTPTTTFISSDKDIKDQEEQHSTKATSARSHWRVPSFYAQLLDVEHGDIVHLTAEKLADEYEKQTRILEQMQAQAQPQPQSSGRKLRRKRRIMRQETWSMDDLKSELTSDKTVNVSSQQEDQIMRKDDPIQQVERSPMNQSESVIPIHAGHQTAQVLRRLQMRRSSIIPKSHSGPDAAAEERGKVSSGLPSMAPPQQNTLTTYLPEAQLISLLPTTQTPI